MHLFNKKVGVIIKYIDKDNLKIKGLFDFGSESSIYELLDKKMLYKEWNIKDYKIILNKVKKLLLLENREEIKDIIVNSDEIVRHDDLYTGYLMEKQFSSTLEDNYLSYDDTIEILKIIKQNLDKLVENGVKYYDLNASNILYFKDDKNLSVKFLDICNAQVDDYQIDTIPPYMRGYINNGGKLDDNGLIYSFNFLTRDLLLQFDRRLLDDGYTNINYNRYINRFVRELDKCSYNGVSDHEYLLDLYKEKQKKLI